MTDGVKRGRGHIFLDWILVPSMLTTGLLLPSDYEVIEAEALFSLSHQALRLTVESVHIPESDGEGFPELMCYYKRIGMEDRQSGKPILDRIVIRGGPVIYQWEEPKND